jgi:hypothetical protein
VLVEKGSGLGLIGSLFRLWIMRGDERVQDEMFSSVMLEQRVPQDHPLREIGKLSDTALGSLSAEFDALYSASGRPSIAPEYMLRALLLQAFYSVRSERLLVEEIDYNLLFRWFVGLGTRRKRQRLPSSRCVRSAHPNCSRTVPRGRSRYSTKTFIDRFLRDIFELQRIKWLTDADGGYLVVSYAGDGELQYLVFDVERHGLLGA